MRGVINQNILSNIQQHDILAKPVTFVHDVTSYNDFHCMKSLQQGSFSNEATWESLIFVCPLIFVS